jgi:hypothetical protein
MADAFSCINSKGPIRVSSSYNDLYWKYNFPNPPTSKKEPEF